MNDPDRTGDYEARAGHTELDRAAPAKHPRQVGRYRIDKVLGEGGFGVVYLAYDEQLDRLVAIKVPHRKLVARSEDARAYLAEARTVANLDHPHIVPVYDVGSSDECPCFIVSKFIEGQTLYHKIKEDRPAVADAVDIVTTIAEALHYAHRTGLVHRDIKPSNILIDTSGKPFVVDFGLALKEENVGHGPRYAGTPAYMSPEQARGEGHRVDGCSDIFSLGVVFYELLVGRQPFRADSQANVMEQVTTFDPRPPRQYDDSIPRELERICLKALCKRASERYTTAKDLADDLRLFLADHALEQPTKDSPKRSASRLETPANQTESGKESARSWPFVTPVATPTADSQVVKIVPKGLRSFDAHDADFFLELLSGPRDRGGLPESLRFWKAKIEEADRETFAVGLIYGPSGCGKSSLVKAGLLPRLSPEVIVVYLEATPAETEMRILNGLRKRFPALPEKLGLKEALAALRRGQGLPAGKKVLIVLDQFEQWLHARKAEQNTELAQALRQCDGIRVQCIVMVRDDFWMAATRFMRELEIRLLEGENSASVDLFDLDHAQKVLAAFGRAFGKLPENPGQTSKEQKDFLQQAVQGLAQEGKVICVRLALFAEMMKSKPWSPSSLRAVGGTAGVGVTFLEETFAATGAPAEHRYHQTAVRAVLKTLLPDSGTNIKGSMRSYADLMDASGYVSRPKDFDDLVRILDGELRLITPTDPEGKDEGGRMKEEKEKNADSSASSLNTRYYQLTHDYLVPALRDWLTRKQKETRRGRAELLLADRSALWNSRPENRQLPTALQWSHIRLLTRKKDWAAPQKKMMAKAARYHLLRGSITIVLLVALTLGGFGLAERLGEQRQANQAAALVKAVLVANIAEVPNLVNELTSYRQWADPLLREAMGEAASKQDGGRQLCAALALLPDDSGQASFLYGQLLQAAPAELPVLRDALFKNQPTFVHNLRNDLSRPDRSADQRLHAASALAGCDDPDQQAAAASWITAAETVTNQLLAAVQRNPSHYEPLVEMLRPARRRLGPSLQGVFYNPARGMAERDLAFRILNEYVAGQPDLLADVVMDADALHFHLLFSKVQEQARDVLPIFQAEIDTPLRAGATKDREILKQSGVIRQEDKITASPTPQIALAKTFDVLLSAQKAYRISMSSAELDSYLLVQNKFGATLAIDDDSGGDLNAELVFSPPATDTYKIFAASLATARTKPNATGTFQVTIVETSSGSAYLEKVAQRQANAALALLKMNQPDKVWPLLRFSPEPRTRSYLADRMYFFGVQPAILMNRLAEEPDVSIRRALILALGEYDAARLPSSDRDGLIDKLLVMVEKENDAGIHGAAEWLLTKWNQGAKVKEAAARLQTNDVQLFSGVGSAAQKSQLAKYTKEIVDIQSRIAAQATTLERKLLARNVTAMGIEGLITHYPFLQNQAKETANAVPNGPKGLFTGKISPASVQVGMAGLALRLEGNGDVVGETPLQIENDQPFSYGCWFLYESKPPLLLLSNRDGKNGYRGFDLSLETVMGKEGGVLRMQIAGEDPQFARSDPKYYNSGFSQLFISVATATSVALEPPPSNWHQVLVTYDGSKKADGVRIYMDGKAKPLDVLRDKLAGTSQSTSGFTVGSRNGGFKFRGKLADVRVYERCLTESQAALLYEVGIAEVAKVPLPARTQEQRKTMEAYGRGQDSSSLDLLLDQLSAAQKEAAAQPYLSKIEWNSERRWFVNGQGQTMIVTPGPVEFLMGLADAVPNQKQSPAGLNTQALPPHTKRISRTFAIAASPISQTAILHFKQKKIAQDNNQHIPALVSWFDAAAYCNWLSAQEGIPPSQWCYETNPNGEVIKIKEKYLSLTGYRLPTEAELEYATRAGTVTKRFYGESDELLRKYLRQFTNEVLKKPNDYGLFDCYGPVALWCQDSWEANLNGEKGTIFEDLESTNDLDLTRPRVLRGFLYQNLAFIHSSYRTQQNPRSNNNSGFRVARTITVK